MSDIDTLMARGADCVAGDIVFKNKSMGRMLSGVFIPTADGLVELAITEVDVDEKPARKARAKKEEVKADPVDVTDVDDLLSGITENTD
jgi:hypothetical protein